MFPIADDNPRIETPMVTWTFIAVCVLVFFWQLSLGPNGGEIAVYQFGMIPARLFGSASLDPDLVAVPAWATVLTSMFMHGGWMHLGFNMLFLWIFGDNVEELPHGPRPLSRLLSAVRHCCGNGADFVNPGSTVPMVGASGAISGVLGAYLLLHPHATVRTVIFLGIFVTMMHLPALVVLGLWILLQLVSAAFFQLRRAGRGLLGAYRRFRRRHGSRAAVQEEGCEPVSAGPAPGLPVERRHGPWGSG